MEKIQWINILQFFLHKQSNGPSEELGGDEETPAKMPTTKTDRESEDFLSNTVNSEISSEEEDPMDQHPPIHKQSKRPTVLQTHPQALLHVPLIKGTDP